MSGEATAEFGGCPCVQLPSLGDAPTRDARPVMLIGLVPPVGFGISIVTRVWFHVGGRMLVWMMV